MNSRRSGTTLCVALGLALLAGCREDVTSPPVGYITVTVVDVTGPPVAGVEIRIAPLGLAAVSDTHGMARFELEPGEYFVDAHVCCRGASFIVYHIPVTVIAGKGETVELLACTLCQ